MNVEKNTKKNAMGNESSINFSEQSSKKVFMNTSYNQDNSLQEEVVQEIPKKKFLYGVRSLFSPMPGYGFSGMMKDFWKTAFTDSFAMLKKRTPLDATTPFQTVLDNWGFSPENMNRTIRIMDVWVLLFSLIQIVSVILFIWGTQSNQPFFFCFQMFMVVLIPPIPLAVTLWKRDVLRTQVPQSFLHWFRHGFLGLAGIMLCVFWFAMPVGQTMAEEQTTTGGAVEKVVPLGVPDMKVTNPKDLSSQLLYKLFGNVWKENTIDVNDPTDGKVPDVSKIFLALFGGINTVALMFVSVFLVYIYAAGAVNGAQMGKWTDDQVFSSFWSPVRSSFAVAFCAPLPSGISLMQGLVFVAIAMSINFANDLKDRVDIAIEGTMVTSVEAHGIMERYDVFSDIFGFALQSAMISYANSLNSADGTEYFTKTDERKLSSEKEGIKHVYGGLIRATSKPWYHDMSEVPSLEVDWANPSPLVVQDAFVGKKTQIGQRTLVEADQLFTEIFFAFKNKDGAFFSEKNFVKFFVDKQNIYVTDVKSIIEEMKKEISTESKQSAIFKKIKTYNYLGWIGIGTYTFSLANAQGAITETLNTAGTKVSVNPVKDKKSLADANIVILKDIPHFTNIDKLYEGITANREAVTDSVKSTKSIDGVMNFVSDYLMKSDLGPVEFAEALQRTNPVNVLTSYGSSLLSTLSFALTSFGVFVGGAEGLKNTAETFPGLGALGSAMLGAITVWSPFVIFVIGGLMSFAAMCVYILPAIPLIFWMRALLTWLILCIETLVGAPFWAATHALPEGKGFAGQHARRGYLMLLDVMIRPTLLVVGATISLLVICVIGFFMGTIFKMWAEVTQISFGFSFVGIFVMTVILMYITYETCVYIFVTAVGHMPEQVIRWAGGQAGSVGTQDAISQGKTMGGKTSDAGRGLGSSAGRLSELAVKK